MDFSFFIFHYCVSSELEFFYLDFSLQQFEAVLLYRIACELFSTLLWLALGGGFRWLRIGTYLRSEQNIDH